MPIYGLENPGSVVKKRIETGVMEQKEEISKNKRFLSKLFFFIIYRIYFFRYAEIALF